jgi:hypothetical protein
VKDECVGTLLLSTWGAISRAEIKMSKEGSVLVSNLDSCGTRGPGSSGDQCSGIVMFISLTRPSSSL